MSSPNDWVYTEKVKEHFMQPKNILMDEENYKFEWKHVAPVNFAEYNSYPEGAPLD